MAKKERADQLVFDAGLADSREKAKRLIMAGQVYVIRNGNPEPVAKPGQKMDLDSLFEVKGVERFVSRGAYKLLTAIEHFGIDPSGKVALDAGASTGGFSDCLLQHGAKKVYAVDVGYGQLHEKLRQDDRVINLERTNLRNIDETIIPEPLDLIVGDVSFISLKLILPPCVALLRDGGELAMLIKPQFELGPGMTEKGVVRDPALHKQAIDDVTGFAINELKLTLVGVVPSSIKGPKGNQEFIAYFKK
ncbi:TlyA family RNA methyltransferase [Halodesulfovibrio marinisediminis]|uniref:23S rRNA (Cytidine1920-2'-O)/16S rRNA (Cytidine1409-2'-O)-methyltransferase n=1 Tax=Halodesulfovibrio marinisediminis DSM 17456 TaxID=1121457 RepID=A0A1N6H1N8_9BACT|nr:TlyA family RNA methyltransferase [Halodesulfovibrio marinisediminis]SIO13666.1 23S rRNA (cytidine1920-2'-O)/16S rRNA (cytidine1409-2'-O)-methyltransferase [Halodesulfovibrio marinisediminis DSM 17456]